MALINCPACNRLVSEAAEKCIHCGHPLQKAAVQAPAQPARETLFGSSNGGTPSPPPMIFRGPPHDCRYCGGELKKKREVDHGAAGCMLLLIGLLLTPIIIGFLIMLLGLHFGSKGRGFWVCRRCEARFERKIKWYEYG